MANAKAIKAKIKSISNIQKITSALEIVSTVKLQKVKQSADNFKEYMTELMYILDRVDFSRVFSNENNLNSNRELIIVISSEKGLCWALNSKLFRKIYDETSVNKDNLDVFVIWKKGLEFFSRSWYSIVWKSNLKDNFTEKDLDDVKWFVADSLEKARYSKISVYFNYFKNTMVQIPTNLQLFPLSKENFSKFVSDIELDLNLDENYNSDIIIEPSEEEYYEFVMKKIITDMIYGSVLQNKAGEHASRMIAMKSAKDNSIDLKKSLTITYNKQRQSAVTQEISEIVSAKVAME